MWPLWAFQGKGYIQTVGEKMQRLKSYAFLLFDKLFVQWKILKRILHKDLFSRKQVFIIKTKTFRCSIQVGFAVFLWKTAHISSIVVEVIRTVLFFFYERYFNYKPHKQNHLTNIQPNIYKKSHLNCPYKLLNNFLLNI